MVRKHLLEWQWSDYVAKHRNRVNLLLHVVAVPLFQIGTVMLLYALITPIDSSPSWGRTCSSL